MKISGQVPGSPAPQRLAPTPVADDDTLRLQMRALRAIVDARRPPHARVPPR